MDVCIDPFVVERGVLGDSRCIYHFDALFLFGVNLPFIFLDELSEVVLILLELIFVWLKVIFTIDFFERFFFILDSELHFITSKLDFFLFLGRKQALDELNVISEFLLVEVRLHLNTTYK